MSNTNYSTLNARGVCSRDDLPCTSILCDLEDFCRHYIADLETNWPRDSENGRLICTSEKPLPKELQKGHRTMHPEAISIDGSSAYFDYYECPACGLRFAVELPE